MKTLILHHKQIRQIIDRLALQVYENNYREQEIIMAGIVPNGMQLAHRIARKVEEVSTIRVHKAELVVNKEHPLQPVVLNGIDEAQLKDKPVVLVDDVLNTGKTMIYGVRFLLGLPISGLQTLVLVDRDHKKFPIRADFAGLSLSTNLQDHVSVVLSEQNDEVFLL